MHKNKITGTMASTVEKLFSCSAVCLVIVWLLKPAAAQTRCLVAVPVPDLGYCDAVGALEENADATIHETRGRIIGIADYQEDAFKLFDEQITTILNQSTVSDSEVRDIEEEVNTMKRLLTTMQNVQAATTRQSAGGHHVSSRRKRAASSALPPGQQKMIDNLKLSFQQSLANVLLMLQNVSKSIADDTTQNAAYHTRLQQDLSTNQKALNVLEQQLQSMDTAIKAVATSRNTGGTGGGTSLSTLRQEVTSLVINASVAEQLAQRELDSINKTVEDMVNKEATVANSIALFQTDIANLTTGVDDAENQIGINAAAEQILETQVNTTISDRKNDLSALSLQLAQADQKLSSTGRTLLNSTLELGQLEVNLNSTQHTIDGIQSLVTLSKKAQVQEIGDILQLKRDITDSINAMKYAFGLLSVLP